MQKSGAEACSDWSSVGFEHYCCVTQMATGRTAAELIFIYACLHVEAKKQAQKRRGGGGTQMTFPKSQSLEIFQEVLEY